MSRILSYTITKKDAGLSVLDYLKALGYSRNILLQIKRTPQGLLLNGEKPYGTTILTEGSKLTVQLKEQEISQITPTPMPLSILYEDEDLMVINKAADTPIHPSQGNHENTLANGIAWYFQEKGEPFVYRCINRLDRDTTGALILAKNSLSACLLGRQLKQRRIRRTYLAVTEGITPLLGTIQAPIARKDGSSIEREVNYVHGEAACTHYERLAVHEGRSLIMLRLETGRTHQIRVHMKHLGYPLLGDYLYYPNYERIGRQALHSYQLEFTHPITGEALLFTAPVPEDFKQAL
ncbi:MAG: RluA family pseudouridine synthase [Blautia sp.]|jgi:23S rRNA pseudouridine1911/1915/1917 synthase